MRVLMTTETRTGIWRYALELAGALGRRGVEVHLATMGAPLSDDQAREAFAHRGLRLHLSRYRPEWKADAWEDVDAAGRWLLGLERRLRPDVIHLNGLCHGALPFAAPVIAVVHSCVLSWWWGVEGHPAPAGWERYRERVARGLRAADLVVAPTRAALEWTDFLHGPLHPVRVIRHGRSAAALLPRPEEPYVAAAARTWDAAKELDLLDAVAGRLQWPVRVAGDTGAVAQRRGRGSGVRGIERLGTLAPEAMAEHLGRAAIFVHPVRYEPFGMTVLEAALAGCALVLSDLPSLREQWAGAAVLVPGRNEEALHRALCELAADPERRSQLARVARLRALEQTPERMAGQYLEAYRQAAAPHRRPVDLSALLPEHDHRSGRRPPAIA